MNNYRLYIVIILANISSFLSYGQDTDTEQSFYAQEMNKMVNIPNSPEAEAFAKYGDFDVSMHTGTPDIAVPIYMIKGREMDINLSLSYDASGIKVEQLASWVGLGWNLNAGGRITRQANGLPDDYIQGNYTSTNDGRTGKRNDLLGKMNSYLDNTSKTFSSAIAVENYFKDLDSINKNFLDTQPDVFRINAPGINTTVVFDITDNNQPKSLDNPRILISNVYRGNSGNGQIIGWHIINEDGTNYYFGNTVALSGDENAYEKTLRAGNDQNPSGTIINEFISSWLLTRIVSPNEKDTFDFSYHDSGYWSEPKLATAAAHASIQLRPNETFYSANEVTTVIADGTEYSISQQFLNGIYHNSSLLVSVDRGIRYDLDPSGSDRRLDKISITNYNGALLREFKFLNATYFNDDAADNRDKKLKLDGLLIRDKNLSTVQEYGFEYDRPNELPPSTSLGLDFAGYYNGANGNPHLFERQVIDGVTFDGANREAASNFAKIGLLNKITYPTGGSTIFDFEGKYFDEPVNNQVTISDLYVSLFPSDDDNNSFYLNANGSIPDDNYSLDGVHPKVKVQRFEIGDNSNDYRLFFSGTAPDQVVEAYIVNVDNGTPGRHFSDYTSAAQYQFLNKVSDLEINWPPGSYQAVILMDELPGTANLAGGPQYASIALDIRHKEDITNFQSVEQGGVRIATIKNYESDGRFSNGKKYQYVEQNRNFRPTLYEVRDIGGATFFIRKVFQPRSESSVTYSKVREFQINQSEESEGYIEYTFFGEHSGVRPSNAYPHENNYYPSVKGGKVQSSTAVNDSGENVQSTDFEYFETYDRPIKIKGFTVFNDDKFLGDYVYVKQNPDGTYGYEHVTPIPCSGGSVNYEPRGFATSGGSFCVPFNCCSAPYVGVLLNENGGLTMKSTFINGAYGGLSVKRDTLYFKDAIGNPLKVVTSNETSYEMDSGFYLPTETTTTDSEGDVFKQTFSYPSSDISAYAALYNKNNLVEVVASKTEKLDANGNVAEFIAARKNEYYAAGQVVLPSKIFTSKISENDLEERVQFSYLANGNLKESKPVNGPTTAYLWGYNHMYPVAKVESATYNQIIATLNTSTIESLTNSDADKRNELDKIRQNLTSALVTTYTYEPLVGMSSITDPRGYATHYGYDDFNRLQHIKDADQKMLEEYEYGYRSANYTDPDAVEYDDLGGSINGLNNAYFGNTQTYAVNTTGGSGEFSYTWYQDGFLLGSDVTQLDVTFTSGNSSTLTVNVVDNANGESILLTKVVTISSDLGALQLAANPAAAHINETVTFASSGLNTGSGNLSYEWSVNNNLQSYSGATDFENAFATAGTYTIRLDVTDNVTGNMANGATTMQIYNQLSTPALVGSTANVVVGQNVIFAPSNVSGGGVKTYQWYVNGTQQSFNQYSNYLRSFPTAGSYQVRFRVTDTTFNEYEEATTSVQVFNNLALGQLLSSQTKIIRGSSIDFTVPTVSGGTSNKSYQWLVNGVSQSTTLGDFTYNGFTNAGNYTVTFKVTDNILNITDEVSRTINVYDPLTTPSFLQSVSHIEENEDLYMTTSNIGGGSGSRNYKWYLKLNNGSYSQIAGATASSLTYNGFNSEGTYTIKFRVTDNNVPSHYRETTKTVNVYEPIQISDSDITTPSPINPNTSTYFNINSATGGSGSFEYEWDVINISSNHTEGLARRSEANRNVPSFTISDLFIGSTRIQCRVHDLNTLKHKTVSKIITVNSYGPLTTPTVNASDTDNDPESAAYRLSATATGGSEQYRFRWIVDNVVVQETTSNTYQYVTLNCSKQSAVVRCVVIDEITGVQAGPRTINLSISGNCGNQ
ncbi:MAG: hypothetical protein AAF039_03780 [Bacteroidota bacterium]